MEKEYKISWLKVIGVIALIIIIIGAIWLFYPKKKDQKNNNSSFINNITLMKKAGQDYFKGNNLPSEIGSSNRISLEDMIDNNLVVEFVDENNKSCNKEDSYVQVTKKSGVEYEMKVFLSCEDKTDYILTAISVAKEVENKDNIETDKNTNANQTNNSSTSTNKNTVSNSSSGSSSNVKNPSNITYCNNGVCCTDNHCVNNVYYTVTFNANGGYIGSNSIATRTVKKGESVVELYPTRDGYRFLGWYLNNSKYDFKSSVTKAITLVAKWEKNSNSVTNKYTVKFNSNGGTFVSSQTVYEGGYATYKTSSRDCYDFAGWYYYDNYNNYRRFDFNTPIYQNITLYAKWIDSGYCDNYNEYVVRFNSNGGTSISSQYVNAGDRAYEPRIPTKNGYTFAGWYLNGVLYNFNNRVYNNITLDAKWTKNSESYSKYCQIKDKTYYSIAYIVKGQNNNKMNWTIRFDNVNAYNLKVTNTYHLSSNSSYQTAFNYQYNKGLSMVNGNSNYQVYAANVTQFKNASLKSNNFGESVSRAYQKNGNWYADIEANIYNTNNVSAYYASNIRNYVYFVPYIIQVQYTDLDNCITDLYSNRNLSKYRNYEIVDTYYR